MSVFLWGAIERGKEHDEGEWKGIEITHYTGAKVDIRSVLMLLPFSSHS